MAGRKLVLGGILVFLVSIGSLSEARKMAASDISISITKPVTATTVSKFHIDVTVDFSDAVAPISVIQLFVNNDIRGTFTNARNLAKGKHTFKAVDISDC